MTFCRMCLLTQYRRPKMGQVVKKSTLNWHERLVVKLHDYPLIWKAVIWWKYREDPDFKDQYELQPDAEQFVAKLRERLVPVCTQCQGTGFQPREHLKVDGVAELREKLVVDGSPRLVRP
jgi:hypothetical protein